MKRRDFLKLTTAAGIGSFVLNGVPLKLWAQGGSDCNEVAERILVVVQLKGGNDGINTLIPLNQYDLYVGHRPTIAIPENNLLNLESGLPLGDQVGLHPALSNLKALYEDAKLSIIQAAGYPSPNKSHFKSTDIWLTGGDGLAENSNLGEGWMGRYLYHAYDVANAPLKPDPYAIQLGDPKASLGFHTHSEHQISINLSGQDPAGFYSLVSEIGGPGPEIIPDEEYYKEIEYIMGVQNSVSIYAERITNVFNTGENSVSYPNTDLANQLKTVARLIRGGCKTKIYLVNQGGYDTHALQVVNDNPAQGVHANLLKTLADALKAFQDDLAALGFEERVLTVTFSEFGRKVKENGNFGTDHGTIAPMFVMGKGINPGVIGTNVDLAAVTNDGQLNNQMQHDYRQVYTTLLQDWLGASPPAISAAKFDNFAPLKLPIISATMKASPDCYWPSTTTRKPTATLPRAVFFPNPVQDYLTIRNLVAGTVVKVNDIYGRNITSYEITSPEAQVDVSNLPSGLYFFSYLHNGQNFTEKILIE